ncbi:MAG: hypothetical protein J1F36_06735 [Clostridiales bacterium]|nr:hypothetical protein [Clostridiales bacterium]
MIKKVFKSEIKRIFADKSVLINILAVAIVLVAFFSLSIESSVFNPSQKGDREELLSWYSKQYEHNKQCYEYLAGISDIKPDNMWIDFDSVDSYYKKMKKYEFYLATGTISDDYIELSDWDMRFEFLHTGGVVKDKSIENMMTFAEISIYIAIIISVVLTVLQSDRYRFSNVSKNYYAANINDRQLFLGKYAVTTTIIFAFWIFMCLWGLCFTLVHGVTQKVLYFSGGAYHSVSVYTFYFTLMLYDLIAMLAFSALVSFIGTFVKKLWQQFALSLGAILLLLGVCLILQLTVDEGVISFIPLWGLYFNSEYYFFNVEFWIVGLINVLLVIVFLLAKIKFIEHKK